MYIRYGHKSIQELLNKTITEIKPSDEQIIFTLSDGSKYKMYHEQDCCESVWLEDTVGEYSDLLNSPILRAEEVHSDDKPPTTQYLDESSTWTYYTLATIKGTVVLRWFGTSNGYYSESVDFKLITEARQ